VTSNGVFLNAYAHNACFGREKEACDLASKASADLSDFLTSPQPSPKRRGGRKMISVPFARENLHLVIFWSRNNRNNHHLDDQKTQPLLSPYVIYLTMGRIVYAPRQLVKLIKDPAYAVYRQVLNLPEQVVSDWETPPWLRPIALFLQNKRPFKRCWPKT